MVSLEPLTPEEAAYFLGFDWTQAAASYCTNDKAPIIARFRQHMRTLVEGGNIEATTDGGWPRVGWSEVLAVAMRDPYGRGMEPCARLRDNVLGGLHWEPVCILDVRRVQR